MPNPSDESRKSPTTRKRNREREYTRNKLKRQIEAERKRLQKRGLSDENIQNNRNMKNMQSLLANSYIDKKTGQYAIEIEKFKYDVESFGYYRKTLNQRRRIDKLTGETNGERLASRNEQFIHEINQSTKEGGFSTLESYETRMFYKLTQKAWNNELGTKARNYSIMNQAEVYDMESIYNMLVRPDEYKNSPAMQRDIEKVLERFGYKISYEEYVKMIQKTKQLAEGASMNVEDTSNLPDGKEDTRYTSYMSFWASYLEGRSRSKG